MKYQNKEHFFQDATNKLKAAMSPEDLEEVKNTEDAVDIQHSFGRGVSNYFGLWNVNKHLGKPCIVALEFTEYFKKQLMQA